MDFVHVDDAVAVGVVLLQLVHYKGGLQAAAGLLSFSDAWTGFSSL